MHLEHRDVSLMVVSRAPLEKLEAYKKRMGWSFKWVSSLGNDFNRDYHVSFTPEEQKQGGLLQLRTARFRARGAGRQRLRPR